MTPIIRFEHVSKYYGTLRANDDLNFSIAAGTIHALIGENGAGKSTAMKLLFGMEQRTSGDIYVQGELAAYRSPKEALKHGIGMVHQHFMLSAVHSALDNVLLGCDAPAVGLSRLLPAGLRPLPRRSVLKKLKEIAEEVQFNIPWHTPVGELSVGIQQQIEIMKLLHSGVDIMIFDEPTAVLSPLEIEHFTTMLHRLKSQGKTIIVITHKLQEVKNMADHVTVMRKGKTVGTRDIVDVSVQDLADLMVGRKVLLKTDAPISAVLGPTILSLKNLTLKKNRRTLLEDIDMDVRSGEIVGIAGVEGNGQSDLLHLLYDPGAKAQGRFELSGELNFGEENAKYWSSSDVRGFGVGIIASDRHHEGVLLDETLAENNLLGHLDEFTNHMLINRKKLADHTQQLMTAYDVRPNNPEAIMGSLSGGNQQKFVMVRELSRKPRLLLCAQPTRGVDVGSIEQIHRELLNARTAGMGILLVSSQLDELMQLSDRLLVMCSGRVVARFARGEFDERKIGLAMGGGKNL